MSFKDWALSTKQVFSRINPKIARIVGGCFLLAGQAGLIAPGINDLVTSGHIQNPFHFWSGAMNLGAIGLLILNNENYPISAAVATTSVAVQQYANLKNLDPTVWGACILMGTGSWTGMMERWVRPHAIHYREAFKMAKRHIWSRAVNSVALAYAHPRATCSITNAITSGLLVYAATRHPEFHPDWIFIASLSVLSTGNAAMAFSRPDDRTKSQPPFGSVPPPSPH